MVPTVHALTACSYYKDPAKLVPMHRVQLQDQFKLFGQRALTGSAAAPNASGSPTHNCLQVTLVMLMMLQGYGQQAGGRTKSGSGRPYSTASEMQRPSSTSNKSLVVPLPAKSASSSASSNTGSLVPLGNLTGNRKSTAGTSQPYGDLLPKSADI